MVSFSGLSIVDRKTLHSFGRCNKSATTLFPICVNESGTKNSALHTTFEELLLFEFGILSLAQWSLCHSARYFL